MPPLLTKSGLSAVIRYESAVPISASSTALDPFFLYVGATTGVTVDTAAGEIGVNFVGVQAGSVLPILLTKVTAASTGYLIALR